MAAARERSEVGIAFEVTFCQLFWSIYYNPRRIIIWTVLCTKYFANVMNACVLG